MEEGSAGWLSGQFRHWVQHFYRRSRRSVPDRIVRQKRRRENAILH